MRLRMQMRSCGLSRPPRLRDLRRSQIATAVAQQKPADPNDPRIGLKPGLRDAGVAARGMELVSTRPRPEGFFDPKNPAGLAMPGERPANATPPAPPHRPHRRQAAAPRSRRPAALRAEFGRAAGRGRAGLRQLRSRVQRHAHGHGQLPRLQRLRHREREEPAAAGVDRLPRRPGRRVDLRQPAVHVGRADARPRRLRHAGRRRDGEQGALPRRAHLRHHRHHAIRSRWRRCRPAAARTRTRSCRRTSRRCMSTARAPAASAPARSWPTARAAIRRRTRTRRSSAST